jgi:hypothetical protein
MYVDTNTRNIIEETKAKGLKIRRKESLVITREEQPAVHGLRLVVLINNSPATAHINIDNGILAVYVEEP